MSATLMLVFLVTLILGVPIAFTMLVGGLAAVWVQGCSLRCPGCCNPELFAAAGGEALAIPALAAWLRAARDAHAIAGLSVLGGEPTDQLAAVAALCREARALGLDVLVFTGRTLAELRALPDADALLAAVDTLIDGRFDALGGKLRTEHGGKLGSSASCAPRRRFLSFF